MRSRMMSVSKFQSPTSWLHFMKLSMQYRGRGKNVVHPNFCVVGGRAKLRQKQH